MSVELPPISKETSMPSFETLDFSVRDGVACIILNRAESANVLSATMTRELREVALFCDTEPDVRALLLTATGRFFCSGGDIRSMAGQTSNLTPYVREAANEFHVAVSTFVRMTKPLVVAVNGIAAGAGFSLALLGDIVIGGASCSFKAAYSAAGLSPDGGMTHFLPRLVGLRRAQELILMNRTIGAEQALHYGILTEIVPDDRLSEFAKDCARKLAAGPARAQGAIRSLLMASSDSPLERQLDLESQYISECAGSADGREGLAAFLERRLPIYL
jgi:2-(1,2-epoxy-1,2-dihydrophenyl)acetyl-CoA isomerase